MAQLRIIVAPALLLLAAAGLLLNFYRPYPTEPPCELGKCQQLLVTSDSGKVVQYASGTKFFVYLNGNDHPKKLLRCIPRDILAVLPDVPKASEPFYYMQFEARQPGTCELSSDGWQVTVAIK